MKFNNGLYHTVALFIGLGAAAFIIHKSGWLREPVIPKTILSPNAALSKINQEAPIVYDMDKMKNGAAPITEPANMKEVYEKYPQRDVGKNLVESWARVKPDEKERISKGLEDKILEAKDALIKDPRDKRAKHTLFIAQTLKNMTECNFNFDLKKKAVVREQPQ